MITQKYIDGKYLYVFSKNNIHWALTPDQVLEMHKLTEALIPEAVQKICQKAEEDAEKAAKAARKALKEAEKA